MISPEKYCKFEYINPPEAGFVSTNLTIIFQ